MDIFDLRYANLHGVKHAATGLTRTAHHMRSHGRDHSVQVLAPLRKKKDWSGDGQSEADLTVTTNAFAISTATSRLTVAANTLDLFATVVGGCQKKVIHVATQAENAGMTVGIDGTVDAGDVDDPDGDAKRWTKTLKAQLKRANAIDRICATELTRLTGRESHGQDGYPLPVFTASADRGAYERSKAASAAPSKSTDWSVTGHTLDATGGEWAAGLPQKGLEGGGFIVGPDMKMYPIVGVNDTRDTNGWDGWQTVAVQTGVASFDRHPRQTAVAGAGAMMNTALGQNYGPDGWVDPHATKNLELGGSGMPPTSHTPTVPYPSRHGMSKSYGRLNVALTPNQIADAYLQGPKARNANYYAYQTYYQTDGQGHRRAVIKTYQVRDSSVQSTSAYVDEHGNFVHRDMKVPPSMHPPHD